MRLPRQAKGTYGQEPLLIASELQEAAIKLAHAFLHQLHSCLHSCSLPLPILPNRLLPLRRPLLLLQRK